MKSDNLIFKRIGAYLIDYLVVLIISTVFVYLPINPKLDAYMEVSEKYTQVLEDYTKEKISMNEFTEKTNELSYEMNKNGAVYIGCNIVVAFLYYGIFAFITKGQTLGKKIMKIKIVSKNDEPAKIYQYFIRAFFINGIIMNIVTLIAINFSRNTYYTIYSKASNLNLALLLIIFLSLVISSSNRGLHDIIAGTKVIAKRNEELEETKKESEANE